MAAKKITSEHVLKLFNSLSWEEQHKFGEAVARDESNPLGYFFALLGKVTYRIKKEWSEERRFKASELRKGHILVEEFAKECARLDEKIGGAPTRNPERDDAIIFLRECVPFEGKPRPWQMIARDLVRLNEDWRMPSDDIRTAGASVKKAYKRRKQHHADHSTEPDFAPLEKRWLKRSGT